MRRSPSVRYSGGASSKGFSSYSVGGGNNRANISSSTQRSVGSVRRATYANFGSKSLINIQDAKKISSPRYLIGVDLGRRGLNHQFWKFPLQFPPLDIATEFADIREAEKELIKNLNNKFVSFIEKVQKLEQRNKKLVAEWRVLKQSETDKISDPEPLFQAYISNLKSQLYSLENNNGHLAGELSDDKDRIEEFKQRYEAEINERISAEDKFVQLKKDADNDYLTKEKLEGKLTSLNDEIDFLKVLHEWELEQIKQRTTDISIFLTIDNSRYLKLDDIIAEVKAVYDQLAIKGRKETEEALNRKLMDLQSTASMHGNTVQNKKKEISQLKREIKKTKAETETENQKIAKLQLAISNAEKQREDNLTSLQNTKTQLEVAINEQKKDMVRLLKDYQKQMSLKLYLDIEIATYRKLLEGEEDRASEVIDDSNFTILFNKYGAGIDGAGKPEKRHQL